MTISIILIEPENPGNIGAIARIMKNFGLKKLILYNPCQNWNGNEAKARAMHGRQILLNARNITNKSEKKNDLEILSRLFKEFDIVISTSAKKAHYKNITRIPIFLDEFDWEHFPKEANVAIVFGRESKGLTNEELILTDFLIKIRASDEYPTFNLSHAVGLTLYTWYIQNLKNLNKNKENNKKNNLRNKLRAKTQSEIKVENKSETKAKTQPNTHLENLPNAQPIIEIANKEEKDRLNQLFKEIIKHSTLREHKYKITLESFKHLIGRAYITKKEFALLMGAFQKIKLILKNPDLIKNHKDENINDTQAINDEQ